MKKRNLIITSDLKNRNLNIVFICALGVLVIISILVTIGAGSKGAEIAYLNTEIQKVSEENESMNSEILNKSSLSEITTLSEGLGLTKPKNVVYLNTSDEVASLR